MGRTFCAVGGVTTTNHLLSALAAVGALASAPALAQGVALRPLTGVNTAADETAPRLAGGALTFVRVGGHVSAEDPGLRWLTFGSADAGEGAAAAATLTASREVGEEAPLRRPVAASTSARGEGIAVAREKTTESGRLVQEIVLSRRGSLDYLAAYDFPFNDMRFNSTDPTLHADGRRMIFASDRPGGYGGYDLYYTEHGAEGWSAPVNLGPEINSAGDDRAAFWGEDGLIAFASDRPGGLGGFDLYTFDASQPKWTAPRHLGLPFSTVSDDTYFAYDREAGHGVLASNRPGGRGGFDLYAFDLPREGGARALGWLPAYTPAWPAGQYTAHGEAVVRAEAALRQAGRAGLGEDVDVEFELSAERNLTTALAQRLALDLERLGEVASAAALRLTAASVELTAGLTEVECQRVLDDCETIVTGGGGMPAMFMGDATSSLPAAGVDDVPLAARMRVRLTFRGDAAGMATASALTAE